MEAAGLAAAVYKDIYFLSKSVYKQATSAQHYRPEQHSLMESFYYEWLYLRTFHNFFFDNKGGKPVRCRTLSDEISNEVLKVFRLLQNLFADFKSVALERDEQYQRYHLASQESNRIPLLEFPLSSSDVISPYRLEGASTRRGRISSFSLRSLIRNHIKEQPIYQTKAWKWSLFQTRALTYLVAEFREYNQQLKCLEPLRLVNQHPADLKELAESIKDDPLADHAAFIPHASIRELTQEYTSLYPLGDNSQLLAQDKSRLSMHQGISSPRIWTEYKTYEGLLHDNSPDGSFSTIARPWSPHSVGSEASSIRSTETPREVHQLARLLSVAGSGSFRTLPFRGYFHEPRYSRFAFYFDFPRHTASSAPTTLHQLITSLPTHERLSLSTRFDIALTISKSLGAFHADGWVHRSMMSHSILFFRDQESGVFQFTEPYLSGCEYSRPEASDKSSRFDSDPEKNMYRHPNHQGPPTTRFNWVHDVYALGIVLLEIGVWQTAAALRQTAMKRASSNKPLNPQAMQQLFLDHARVRLKHSMGDSYMEAVVACLSDEILSHIEWENPALVFRKLVVDKIDPRRLLGLAIDH